MAFLESAFAFLVGFVTWFWPVFVLVFLDVVDLYGRFLRERIGESWRGPLESIVKNKTVKTVVVVAAAFIAAAGAFHDLRMEKETEIARLESELFRVGVVYSERLEHVANTTWKAQNEIGKIISLRINGLPVPFTTGLFEIERDRIAIQKDVVEGKTISGDPLVELVYMARHSGR